MTSLDEHDKQLLETLLNQADAVAPATDKTHQSERGGELDFHNAEHDDNDFKFLEHYINSEMAEGEAMQFEQPASSSAYTGQEAAQQYQATAEAHQSTSAASGYQGQGSSGFGGQQTRFSGVAQVHSPVQMKQSAPSSYQGQGHGYQQIQSPSVQSPQMNLASPDGFQNQNTGFQQQYSSGGASAQSGQLAEAGSVSSGFSNQSQTYPQQYSMETSSTSQGDISGHAGSTYQAQGTSYQTHTQQQSSESQGQQQQFSQHESGYPNSCGKEQVGLSGVYQNQSTDYQHQQTFQNEYTASGSTNNPSLQAVGQGADFQQQFSSSAGSKPAPEQTDFSQQQAMQDFTKQVTGYPQQQQQQAAFHQRNQSTGNSGDQAYQASGSDGAAICYSGDLTGYGQQTGQQHQAAVPTNTGVASPSGAEAVGSVHHQQAQYQESVPPAAQIDQASAGTYQNQVNVFQKQQSFSSPTASPGQPSQVVPASPAGYPQPSPQSAYSPSAQGDQCGGANFTGQKTGFQSGQISGFSQQIPFQTQNSAPSPGQAHVDNSVPSSPANSYQQPSPAYPAQNTFPAHIQSPGTSLNQGDQNAGGNFSSQKASHYSVPSAQNDGSAQSQSYASQAMQEGAGHSSMETEAAAFLQKFQSVNQQNQAMESSGTVGQYQQNPVSQASIQRDQPMETQQSPYLSGTGSSSGAFASQPQAPQQQGVYQEATAQMGQTSLSGSGYMDQALSFQSQSSTYQTSSALPAQSLSSSIGDYISAQGQNTAFATNSKFDESYHNPTSAVFGSQSVFSSGQTTNTSFSLTTSAPSVAADQPAVSGSVTNQYNQTDSRAASFNQFPSSAASTFGHSGGLEQFQQYQPSVQQQSAQQAAYTSQSQDSSLIQSANSHASMTGSQTQLFQAGGSSSQPAAGNQTSVADPQFGAGQFQSQQAGKNPGQQQGMHNPLGHTSIGNVAHSIASEPQAQFGHSAAQGSSMPGSFSAPDNIGFVKSPTASLQDSNQTNSALTLLSSVLQQIQAILPVAVGQEQKGSTNSPQATSGQAVGGDPDTLAKLLNSQNSAQQVLQLLQQQAGNQKPQSQGQQNTGQSFQLTLQQQLAGSSAAQHPNFLIQQGSGQPQVLSQQQPSQQMQQQQLGQQLAASQVPVSAVVSLPGNMGIAEGGQFLLGQQPVKVVLDANSAPLIVSGGFSVPSSVVIAQSSAAVAGLASMAPVSLSDQTVLPQSGTHAVPVGVSGMPLPVDLQNVKLHVLSSTGSPALSSMTHTISTTPTTVPNIGSSFSKNTFVTPTSSFTQPLQVAGVGLGVGASTVTPDAPADPNAYSAPSANPDLGGHLVKNFAVDGSSVGSSPAVANIFFPVSTESSLEKALAAPVSSLPSSAQVGNFLNVTTGSASMLLNAMSMAAADGKRDSAGFKVNSFSGPSGSAEGLFGELHRKNQGVGKMDASEMDVGESLAESARGVKPMDTDKPLENLSPRHSSRKTSMEEDFDVRGDALANSMLRKILTMKDEEDNAPRSKAGSPSPETSPIQTPVDLCVDTNTQSTLIEKSEKLKLGSDAQTDEDMQPTFWNSVPAFANEPPEEEVVPSKVHRGADDVDASSKQVSLPSVEKLFDAGGANSSSAFVFTKFGAEVPGLITFGNSTSDAISSVSTNVNDVRVSSVVSTVKPAEPMKLSPVPTASIRPNTRKQKDPGLTFQFPSKVGECELRILSQPEEQHRARYLTEGSRGAVKDRSQQGYPVIKLLGYNEPATLQVFIGSETGRVKPHGFYQACKVCGKNSTQCSEREIDGTNVIEIEISPINDMQVTMDCVGILKLRNADVEKRIGPTKAKAKKKNSTKARLVFRATLRKPDGSYFTLQVASTPILCTQPIGQPEISRMSLSELCVNQTSDLFIIGKNFLKGTQIMFQELGADETEIKWQSEAEIEVEYFQQTHLICRIPEYPRKDLDQPVHCQIVALSGGKVSDPQDFLYKPAMMMIKEENAMETEPCGVGKALPFGVSPVALQLNRLVERTQHLTSSSAMFQLPPGAIPSIGNSSVLATPSKVVPSAHAQPILKPATLSLPGSGQTLTLGPPGGGGDGKGAVPVQFVLPPHAVGSAVTLDSRKVGGQQPQFVLMPNSAVASPGGSTLNNNKVPQSVFTLNSLPGNTSNQPSSVPGGGVSAAVPNQGPSGAASTSPMIVILTGPPGTPTSTPVVANNMVNNNNNNINNNNSMGVPLSGQQPVTNGQVSEPKP